MSEKFGSPTKPLRTKCTSIGFGDVPYWCLVADDGTQYYFEIRSWQMAMMISSQSNSAALKIADEMDKAS